MSEVTVILNAIDDGDAEAAHKLLPLLYDELRRLAASKMANEPAGHTLQPTALVHEAWLRLIGNENQSWDNRGHFFGAAAEAMRRILVENARRKSTLKRGVGLKRINLDDIDLAIGAQDEIILEVSDALSRFATIDPTGAELIKLRFFAGLPLDKAAKILGLAERTAKRTWAYGRAWMHEELMRSR